MKLLVNYNGDELCIYKAPRRYVAYLLRFYLLTYFLSFCAFIVFAILYAFATYYAYPTFATILSWAIVAQNTL